MNEALTLYLGGSLVTHARGNTLTASFGATPCETPPAAGALFVLGTELQSDAALAQTWIDWAAWPGRLLVVLPPFRREPCELPVQWEARRTESLAGGESELGKLLARERRHEIRGRLLPLERNAGQVVTAGWRRHPAAGLVAITTLPLWSLTALDHREACTAWLTGLIEQAGKPASVPAKIRRGGAAAPQRLPTDDEWALLLHLCTGPFESESTALVALSGSAVHALRGDRAERALQGVITLGFVKCGSLTATGEKALLDGPYAAYARGLRREA